MSATIVISACHAVPPTMPTPTITSIAVLYSTLTKAVTEFDVSAYALDSDGAYRNVTKEALWSSSNPAIVSSPTNYLENARASVHGAGSTRLFATYGGVTGQLLVETGPRPVSPLAVEGHSPQGVGASIQFRAWYSTDTQRIEVARLATWRSSDSSVLTFDRGMGTGLRVGNVRIEASYQGHTDYAYVAVVPGLAAR